MIRVEKQPEPENFFNIVTKKANKFFKKNPEPGAEEIQKNKLWRKALPDLYKSYRKICAYSALWCSRDAATVDHFIPIAIMEGETVKLAYDWDNFRLASRSMNTEKKEFQDVIDPFRVKPGWFAMDFPSLIIRSGEGLTQSEKKQVEDTISRLKLNENTEYIEYRAKFLWEYCKRCKNYIEIYPNFDVRFELEALEEDAPFIASELKRQGLEKQIIYMYEISCIFMKKDHYD